MICPGEIFFSGDFFYSKQANEIMIDYILKKIFGTRNTRELKKIQPLFEQINLLEAEIEKLTDQQLAAKTPEFKERLDNGENFDSLLPETFAVVREVSKRVLNMRHFDEQLIGGIVLHQGKIAEMKTGEGKTLVATLPVYLNALTGEGVHLITVNDYLAQRDSAWMGKIYSFLGMETGVIVHGLNDQQRQKAYRADITYGTNNEFGFDYLRDNMKVDIADFVQRPLHYAIVDEVDSILIDEARTPLIISGPAEESTNKYYQVNGLMSKIKRDIHFTVDEKSKSASLTEEGVEKIEKLMNLKNLYDAGNIEIIHHVNQALRANYVFKRDVDYVVEQGKVVIVDEFTGRLMPGRRWSDGLHQSIEVKEGVKIENENQTLATITFQNYFRMYKKLSGMTGTAETEAEEFGKIYKLDVMIIPTHMSMIRTDAADQIYKSEAEKFNAVANDIIERHKNGQPILVGTISIEKSEMLHKMLKRRGVPHNILNAKHHKNEAFIIAQAGRKKALTISTNMAGRGTDIMLGGNPEYLAKAKSNQEEDPEGFQELLGKFNTICQKEKKEVIEAGGLYVLGTERHESRRIDNQLRGRSGRQGDPGLSRFYMSMEDDLLRIFGSEKIQGLMERLGMEEGQPIEHKWVTNAIENAQRRVEGHNFDIRKYLLEYDDVMNNQRKTIYSLRNQVLSGENIHDMVLDGVEEVIIDMVDNYCSDNGRIDEWDIKSLEDKFHKIFSLKLNLKESEYTNESNQQQSRQKIEEFLFDQTEKFLIKRQDDLGNELFPKVEQLLFLNQIDSQWKDHLQTLDHLKEGINLRGYGQRNPKLEYQREGFNLFSNMMFQIKHNLLEILSRVEISQEEALDEVGPKKKSHTIEGRGNGAAPIANQGTIRRGPKVGRNEPCPCGSGKKYKKCCGKGK